MNVTNLSLSLSVPSSIEKLFRWKTVRYANVGAVIYIQDRISSREQVRDGEADIQQTSGYPRQTRVA